MEMILFIILGMFVGWNLPQPAYAKWFQNKVVQLFNKLKTTDKETLK
jgi:hypothetical protein